ncbi:MAG TPA: tetratricopeptide repeat protein [Burkholderiaceae bacterium]|nr:tetratricopeptide repeat protein [Burkholderiaceae bacterium]
MASIDLGALWDFAQPALSEQRFRAALAAASGDDVLILETQIARTYGLRRDFARARELLAAVEPHLARAGPEAQARYWLELGRSWCSATHGPEELTPQAKTNARAAYDRALALAKGARLDALAIDTLHMFAFVDTDPAAGIMWADEGLKIALASEQPAAARWEAALRNNRGYALQRLGRHDEALAEFKLALTARERLGEVRSVRIAHWMIANTLRLMGRLDEARDIQLRLECEWDADAERDPYVFEELEQIYRAQGHAERAAHYAARLKASKSR